MDEKTPYFMDRTISDHWFDQMDKAEHYRQQPLTDWFSSSRPHYNERPGTVSINNSKYYSLPCNCGLIDNISTYQRLRTQIYFDTYTKNFYKSDINSTAILPNGLPYMNCPRHSQYFSDVIRSYINTAAQEGEETSHQKIVLFDGKSSHYSNYAISNSSHYTTNAEQNGNNILFDDKIGSPKLNSQTMAGTGRFSHHSPINHNYKHFPTCSTYQNEHSSCNCEEQLSTVHQNYVRENSVVADVLGDHGIDVVVPPQDFYMLNNPLFKDPNKSNSGTRLAKARWIRRNNRLDTSMKNDDYYNSRCRDRSLNRSRKQYNDSYGHDASNNNVSSSNMEENNESPFTGGGFYHPTMHDYSQCNNISYIHGDYSNKPTVSFNDTINDNQYIGSSNKSKVASKNATFTVFTRPKRRHSEHDDFYVESGIDKSVNQRKNLLNQSHKNSILLSQSKSASPEDDLQRWVTVIGFQPRLIAQVIRYMNNFGPIIKIKTSKTCNYMHLMYSRVDCAENAIQKATISLDNSMIVSIKPCTNTFIPNEQVQCFEGDNEDINQVNLKLNVSNYFSWFKSAISKVVDYVDEFINEP